MAWVVVGPLAVGAYAQPAAVAQERRECGDFATQEQAQRFFDERGGLDGDHAHLDVDRDGIACEGLPKADATPTPRGTPAPTPRATPAPTPRDELPENGAGILVLALSGVTLLQAGYGMTLFARRRGLRSRELSMYMPRNPEPGARQGDNGHDADADQVFIDGRVYAALARPFKPDLASVNAAATAGGAARRGSMPSEEPVVDELGAQTLRERAAWPFFASPN